MGCERVARTDPETGVRILQLTSFPITHWHLGLGDFITPDGERLLIAANRFAGRNSPRDLYSIRADGDDFNFLLHDFSGGVICPRVQWVYTGCAGGVVRIPIEGGTAEVLWSPDCYTHIMVSARSSDGLWLFGQGRRKTDGSFDIVRISTETGEASVIVRASYVMPVLRSSANGERLVASIAPVGDDGKPLMPWGVWEFSSGGTDFRLVPFSRSTNHYCPMGSTGLVVTTAAHPGNALDVAAPGGCERVLARGTGFWHVSSDETGTWLASDTNWPDVGLQIVNSHTGKYATLCMTGASGGHPQWTHAHPVISPDARWVLFTSDRAGFQHVYLADIPPEFKKALSAA
ncbi:MAG TPA: hypothetical protein PLM57_10055 [Candidatus Latescibacteria bacterium]|nr:hypothetical protein [Candidatus Latescibacterota bacterium]